MASEIGDEYCEQVGFTGCPFTGAKMAVKDGRDVEMPSNGFGTVFATVDGEPVPLVDYAGYAPFGYGYRRCAGEWLTVDFIKDVLRHAWAEGLVFKKMPVKDPEPLPVGPVVAIGEDDIGFTRSR